jgi:hypothetical protein
MSRALRGDFERLRDRGVASTLTQPAPTSTPGHEPEAPSDETTAAAADDGADNVTRVGLLSRLLGR